MCTAPSEGWAPTRHWCWRANRYNPRRFFSKGRPLMSLALVFPGQGSQSVGMLGEFAGLHAIVRRTYEEASGALGYDLWQLTACGPAEQLNKTECTQPAMLVAGVATLRLWQEHGGRP